MEYNRTPSLDEREECRRLSKTCSQIVALDNQSDTVETREELDQVRQDIDQLSGLCQRFQSTFRERRNNLPCRKVRSRIVFQLESPALSATQQVNQEEVQ